MDKDRVVGKAKEVKGDIKEQAGKSFGDKSLEREGRADQAEGKVQNAAGKAKDAVRDAVKKI